MSWFPVVSRFLYICKNLLSEALTFFSLMAQSHASLAAEILFLRKQLAFYQERKIKPRRFDDAARLSMLLLSKVNNRRGARHAQCILGRALPFRFLHGHG
jgi:hypothetical protein